MVPQASLVPLGLAALLLLPIAVGNDVAATSTFTPVHGVNATSTTTPLHDVAATSTFTAGHGFASAPLTVSAFEATQDATWSVRDASRHETRSTHDPGPPVLYFHHRQGVREQFNFTTFPPTPNATGSAIQFVQVQFSARNIWALPFLPADWNITAGSAGDAVLHLSGLDDLLPIPPTDENDPGAIQAGAVRIRIDVMNGSGERLLGRGDAWHRPEPEAPAEGPRIIRIPMTFVADQVRSNGPPDGDGTLVRVEVTGRTATNVSPVHLHVGAAATPSSIALPGFPYGAMRAWDIAEREAACAGPLPPAGCPPEDNDDGEDGAARNTPFVSLPAAIVLLVSMALHRALRERERCPRT